MIFWRLGVVLRYMTFLDWATWEEEHAIMFFSILIEDSEYYFITLRWLVILYDQYDLADLYKPFKQLFPVDMTTILHQSRTVST